MRRLIVNNRCPLCGEHVEMVKDSFSDRPRVRKFKVYFYKTAKNGTIEEPPKTTVIFGRTETEVEHKFKLAYRVYHDLIFGWAEEMDDVECLE